MAYFDKDGFVVETSTRVIENVPKIDGISCEEVVLFEKLIVPAEWDNAQMDQLKRLKITVDAFGVQQYGFASCYDAMTTAFGGRDGEFNFN